METSADLEYVGFWPRVGASLIDTLLMVVLTTALLLAIYGMNYFSLSGSVQGPADFVISYVLPLVIVVAFWRLKNATPGKMAIGAEVIDARSGGPASMGQCIGRYFAYFVSTIPLCLGFAWVGFDRKKQGWHDKLAGTVVVRKRDRRPAPVHLDPAGS